MPVWLKELRPTVALALPIMLGQMSQMLMGVVDSIMIGRVGTVPLAAASFTSAVFGFFFIGCIGLLQPGSVLVAREHGAGRKDLCGVWLHHARVLAWAAGGVLAGVMASALLIGDRFGQPAEVVATMGPYFALIAVSLVPTMLFQVDRQFAEAQGRPWEPLVIMLASVGLNVVLNWVLIYGKLGVPALGLTGAGVATLLARCAAVWVQRVWLRRHAGFAVAMEAARTARVERGRSKRMLALGVPMGAALFFEGGAFSAAGIMAGWLGTVPLAAHQIAMSCAAMAFMVPLGLSIALSVRVGRAVGAGRREAVLPMTGGAAALTVCTAATATLFFLSAGERVAQSFVTNDPAVVALAARVLVIAGIFQLVDGLQVVFGGALRGLTDVKVPMLATLVAYWVVALPGGYLLGVRGGGGLETIWIALAGGLAAAALGLGWRLRHLIRTRTGDATR
jgi:MATE family multidrug resistance protein